MLIIPKISKKKLTAYIIIIITMFSGAGYFLYRSYNTTAPKSDSEISEADKAELQKIYELMEAEDRKAAGVESENAAKKEEDSYYISIFENSKFQSLIDNSVSSSSPAVGKKNPFVPN